MIRWATRSTRSRRSSSTTARSGHLAATAAVTSIALSTPNPHQRHPARHQARDDRYDGPGRVVAEGEVGETTASAHHPNSRGHLAQHLPHLPRQCVRGERLLEVRGPGAQPAPRIVALSRASYRKMVQNLWWAAGYNIVAIPLAAGVLASRGIVLSPAIGAVLMSLSTVIVAVNAQLLRRVRL
jgi:hypothetical protein